MSQRRSQQYRGQHCHRLPAHHGHSSPSSFSTFSTFTCTILMPSFILIMGQKLSILMQETPEESYFPSRGPWLPGCVAVRWAGEGQARSQEQEQEAGDC